MDKALLQEFLVSLTYPPALSAWILLAGCIAMWRWRKLGAALVAFAVLWSLLWSVPACSDWLRGTLERRNPVREEARLPQADAVVVLGGGVAGAWILRSDVDPDNLKSSRLAAGARAWLAHRAPLVILSGGGGEAQIMASAIARLGVPKSALALEERSRNTRDNASMTAQLGRRMGIRRVLLVTSSLHMPRARLLFCADGMDVTPVPVPELAIREGWKDRWIPTRSAVWRSGRALKEYVALVALFMEMKMNGSERSALKACWGSG